MARKNVLIIGGGICGLSIGWYLARAGTAVTVVERGQAGHGATWASAGMLAPQLEAEPGEEVLLSLLLRSKEMWSQFAEELKSASGTDVEYRTEGTIMVGLNSDDESRLRFLYDFQSGKGLKVRWMSGYEARQMEPHLSPNVAGGIFSPLDHQVNSRMVAVALREALIRAGGELREHTDVESVEIRLGKVFGVKAGGEVIQADTVVLAAGAWSRDIPGIPEKSRPPVRPVKGQMLALQMEPGAELISHVVWGPDVYMVPRRDGRLLVGATVEEMGFDSALTAGGLLHLLRGAWETVPAVYELPIAESWVGFRPGSRDDAPILGPTEVEGLVMATGHYRNGILLAPITAQAVSHYVLTGQLVDEAKPFTLARVKA